MPTKYILKTQKVPYTNKRLCSWPKTWTCVIWWNAKKILRRCSCWHILDMFSLFYELRVNGKLSVCCLCCKHGCLPLLCLFHYHCYAPCSVHCYKIVFIQRLMIWLKTNAADIFVLGIFIWLLLWAVLFSEWIFDLMFINLYNITFTCVIYTAWGQCTISTVTLCYYYGAIYNGLEVC